MKLIIFGGAGYIGATAAQLFLDDGHEVTVVDNLTTGHKEYTEGAKFIEADIIDKIRVEDIISEIRPDVVLHFAAKIQVEESTRLPVEYFQNNVFGTINIIEAMLKSGNKNLVFSSTAAVYGEPEKIPISEDDRKLPINPYGLSKWMVEQMLDSYSRTHGLNWTAFRYFNAAGTYKGRAMDYPVMTHLIPHAVEAVLANRPFKQYGDDYPTQDGSCIRDFVHVIDIAKAHIIAAEKMSAGEKISCAMNLGSGSGYSVKQVLNTVKDTTGRPLEITVEPRRVGDPAVLIADSTKASRLLGWKPELSLEEMVKSHWEWRLNQAGTSRV